MRSFFTFFILMLLLPLELLGTELWMVYPRVVDKGKPMEIRIYFGDYGSRTRPFFGRITLYIKDPLGKSYKVPLRRGKGLFSTTIIPDVSGSYRLRCVGDYFGDRFVTFGRFFVKSFFKKPKPCDFGEPGGLLMGVRMKGGRLELASPKVCSGGVWMVKDPRGRLVMKDEGVNHISVPLKPGIDILVVYSCGDWTFSYLHKGGP